MKKSCSNQFGDIIRFHRKQSGLTQLELADLAGLGKATVFDLEKGKPTVRLNNLLKVIAVLNIALKLESPLMEAYEEQVDEKS